MPAHNNDAQCHCITMTHNGTQCHIILTQWHMLARNNDANWHIIMNKNDEQEFRCNSGVKARQGPGAPGAPGLAKQGSNRQSLSDRRNARRRDETGTHSACVCVRKGSKRWPGGGGGTRRLQCSSGGPLGHPAAGALGQTLPRDAAARHDGCDSREWGRQ
jgi:hypothetical protein